MHVNRVGDFGLASGPNFFFPVRVSSLQLWQLKQIQNGYHDDGELKNLMDSDEHTKFCEEEDAHNRVIFVPIKYETKLTENFVKSICSKKKGSFF